MAPQTSVIASRLCSISLVSLTAGLFSGGMAKTQTQQYAVGDPESSHNFIASHTFAEAVRRPTGLNIKVVSLSLLGRIKAPGGIRDSIADFGFALFQHCPQSSPRSPCPPTLRISRFPVHGLTNRVRR